MTDTDDFTKKMLAKVSPKDISFEDIIKKAENRAKSAPEGLRRTAYLYYLSEHYLLLYEAIFLDKPDFKPDQVFNEYRNGLSCLIYFLSGGDDVSQEQRNRRQSDVEGHIQRALLDLCKCYAYSTRTWANEFEEKNGGMRGLALVSDDYSDGDSDMHPDGYSEGYSVVKFVYKWVQMRQDISTALVNAKTGDSRLGKDNPANDNIVKLYLDVAYKCYQLVQLGEKNRGKIAIEGRSDLSQSKAHKDKE